MFIVKNIKSSYYQIIYTVNGKRTSRSTNTSSRQEAELILKEFNNSSNESTQGHQSSRKNNTGNTIGSFRKEYVEYLRPTKSRRYIISIELSFNQFINYCGDISLIEVTKKQINQFISTTFARTERGAHQYFRTLKAAFNKAVEWGYVETNLFQK